MAVECAASLTGAMKRYQLVALPLCEKYGLVWVIPTADGTASFDVDPWLGGLADELASLGLASWSFYDRRPEYRLTAHPTVFSRKYSP